MGAAGSMPSPPWPLGAADRAPGRRRTRTAPERSQRPSTQNPHPPTAALRLPPLPLPPAAAGARPPPPLIGYSRARDGADRVVWTSLRAAAERKPRPPRDQRALPRRREGKIMEAATLPSSRHAPRGDGPWGTPGGVVRPQNPPQGRPGEPGRANRHPRGAVPPPRLGPRLWALGCWARAA